MLNGNTCYVPSPFSPSPPDSFIIKINLTRALNYIYTRESSQIRARVYLAFPPDPAKPFPFTTEPIALYPGFHLFGKMLYSFRDTFASRSDLALGIPRVRGSIYSNHFFPLALLIYK
jgi:hypothetical protein